MKQKGSIYLKLLLENAKMAIQTLLANKLRSILSVSGISIGIFSIVMVYTIITSLEFQIKNSLSSLGKTVVYIEVFPWESEDRKEYPWWKYMQRPDPTLAELQQLKQSYVSDIVEAMSFRMQYYGTKLVNTEKGITLTGIEILGITYDFSQIQEMNLTEGRYFTEQEIQNGAPVAVVGNQIASKLFGSPSQALGKRMRVGANTVDIIGVLALEGEGIMGMSSDEQVFVSVYFLQQFTGIKSRSYNPRIMVKAADGIAIDALAQELQGAMRGIRKLKPNEENNFAVNKVTFLIEYLRDFFGKVNLFGLIIGGFSLLVGGFGVANIMFVSVKERTGIIGVQKALGAKSVYILQQFLTEAIVLCLLGGGIGLIFVTLITYGANYVLAAFTEQSFRLVLSYYNVLLGVFFSIVTGLVAGIIPAWFASKMAPVEAIRSNG
jgi:putative ABC transport system permease protein